MKKLKAQFNIVYITYIILIIVIFLSTINIFDIFFRIGVISYLVLIFVYFIDSKPPKFLDCKGDTDNNLNVKYFRDLNEFMDLIMKSINIIQSNKNNTDIINSNFMIIESCYRKLIKITPPIEYVKRHNDIISSVHSFLKVNNETD